MSKDEGREKSRRRDDKNKREEKRIQNKKKSILRMSIKEEIT
jgi:hypothetical protein